MSDGMKVTYQGSGGGGKGGSDDPTSLRSNATATFIDALCEGEIEGLVGDAKGIYFGDTPLQNEDDSYNFQGVEWQLRAGLPDQEPFPGAAVATEVSVGATVAKAVPISRNLSDSDYTSAVVTIRVPALVHQTDSGSKQTSVQFKIEVKENGGTFVDYFGTITITGKNTSPYDKSFKFKLPQAAVGDSHPWTIRVTRITDDSEDIKLQNDIVFASYTALIDEVLTYPDTALLGVTIDAEKFGQTMPSRGYLLKGRKSPVPSNYDPETREYDGIWDGTFKTAYHTNPAWAFYDMLTHRRFGMGEYVDPTLADKWTLYTIGKYCDELVPDGYGGTEPRFAINAIFGANGDKDAYEFMQSMAAIFRGVTYWSSGMVTASQDAPADAELMVTRQNVEKGLLNYSSSALSSRHSVVEVTWADPLDLYYKAVEVVRDDDAVLQYGVRTKRIDASSYCTSRGQARRIGRWILFTEQIETQALNYVAGLDHAYVRPGSIIDVMDSEVSGVELSGRAVSYTESEGNLTEIVLDREVEIDDEITSTLFVMRKDMTVAEGTVTNESGTTDTLTLSGCDFGDGFVDGAIWVLTHTDVTVKKYRVMTIEEKGPLRFEVAALEHNTGKYDTIDSGADFDPPATRRNARVSPPTDATGAESHYYRDGVPTSSIVFSWKAPDGLVMPRYEARVTSPDGQVQTFQSQNGTTVTVYDVQEGTYTLEVESLGITGGRSSTLSYEFEADGWEAEDTYVADLDLADLPGETNFTGRSPKFTWRNIVGGEEAPSSNSLVLRNIVKVYDVASTPVLLRTEYTVQPSYTYDYEKNVVDNAETGKLASREIRIDVQVETVRGVVSEPNMLSVSNPAPAAPTVQFTVGVESLFVASTASEDPDFAGMKVWINENAAPDPEEDDPVYSGPSLGFSYQGTSGVPHYVVVGHYDVFDTTPENFTDPEVVTPAGAFDNGLLVGLANVKEEVIDRFEAIEADVDSNADDVGTTAAALAQEIIDRAAAVAAEADARADAIAAEASARSDAITAESEARDAMAADQAEGIRRTRDDLLSLATEVVDVGSHAELDRQEIRREIKVSSDTVTASFTEAITVATGPDSALVQAQTTLEAAIEDEVSAREASIEALQTAYTTADEALASQQSVLEAAISDEVLAREASIDDVNAAYAAADSAIALQTSELATQIRGSYEGSDYTLAGGLIAQLNASVTTQFESVSTALASISAGVGEQFDFSTIWNFDNTIQSWTGNGTPTWVSGGGWMRPANHASDPYVVSPSGLEVDLDTYPQVRMRIRKTGSPTWEGYLWWKLTGDGSWDAGRRVTMDEPTFEGGIALVSQDLGATGELDQIRIDLSDAQDGTDYFDIDWVAVGRPSPGASVASLDTLNQALSNAINSEASSREALSTKIFGVTDPTGLSLGDLSSGLLYSESTARSDADTAILESITVLEGAVDDVESDLSATGSAVDALDVRVTANEGEIGSTASALSSLSGTVDSVSSGLSATGSAVSALDIRVTANEGEIESVSSSLDALGVTVAGKADASALEDIETDINISNLEGLTAHSRSLRELEAVILADALEAVDIGAGAQLSDQQAAAAAATVREEVYSRTEQNESELAAIAGRTETIEASLAGLATASHVATIESRVTQTEAGVESAVESIEVLSAALDETEADTAANADAISTTNATVSDLADVVSANSSDITGLTAAVDTKATASALDALSSTVSSNTGSISSVASRTSALESTVNNGSTGVAATASALSSLTTTVNKKAQVFSQTSAPSVSGVAEGSLWIDTDNDNKTHVLESGSWVDRSVSGMTVFAQSSTPTTSVVGALWYDTDNGNEVHRWSGSEWVSLAGGSYSEDITELQNSYNDLSAEGLVKFEQLATPSGLDARFAVKLRQSTGSAYKDAGFYLDLRTVSGVQQSEFAVLADRFVVTDGSDKSYPLVFEDGDLKLENITVGTVKFDRLESHNEKVIIEGTGSTPGLEVYS